MPIAEVNGTALYFEDTGPGSTGKTIAFMHGLLWGTELFAPQINRVSHRRIHARRDSARGPFLDG
jgi:hypothetical protein